MGAICTQEQSEKLQSLVNDALDRGAKIVARGTFGHLPEGAVDQYFPPTVIVDVNHTMKLMQEEVVILDILFCAMDFLVVPILFSAGLYHILLE